MSGVADLEASIRLDLMTREEAVRSLLAFDRPLDELRERVAAFPFDWDGAPLGTLRRDHVLAVLARWQSGELNHAEVEEWANLIEVRDDLVHDPDDPAVAEAVFDLANPIIQGPLQEIGPRLLSALGYGSAFHPLPPLPESAYRHRR